jgi:LAS superfamily LD-carboxypeptidase LdcB
MKKILFIIGIVIAAGALSYDGYAYMTVLKENKDLQNNIIGLGKQIGVLAQTLASTNLKLASANVQLSSTTQSLESAQNTNATFAPQINQLSGTVASLQTIASIDPQLLQKYSKVYFLSDNYTPTSLSPIDIHYLYNSSTPQLFLSGTLPDLDALLANADRDGVPLRIISAYRSFYEQSALKLDYVDEYGSGANQFSADQGYSEHQLGTAVDFGMQGAQNLRAEFASSTGYQWLMSNAYRFGFILSYPQGNTYYQFEPWHWRYVGVALATKLHGGNEYFYNMSQRDIDQYLISFFDPS